MLFRFRASLWHVGMAVNHTWGSVLYSAHLYDALRNEVPLDAGRRWEDMDLIKILLGCENFYVGDAPKTRAEKTRAEYQSKFCLSIGVSAASFTQRKKK